MIKTQQLLFGACLLIGLQAVATDWPHFRGPNFDGHVQGDKVLKGKTFSFEVEWKRELGSGYSCISVVNDIAVTMFSDASSDWITAFDPATGIEKWRYEFGPVYLGHSGSQDGPSGTPTIYDGIVYGLDPHGIMVALNLADGKKLWGYHLGKDLPALMPHYGFCTTPAIVDDVLVLMTGDKQGKALTGLHRKTGQILWQAGNDSATYQSPIIWERAGKKSVLAMTDHFLMELDPNDGKVLWQAEHHVEDNESFALPILFEQGKVLIVDRKQAAAFQLAWADGKAILKELWRSTVFMRAYSLPIYHEGFFYGFRSHFLSCVDALTGEIKWRSRPPGGQGLTFLDGQLLIISGDGDMVAVEANPQAYRETTRAKLFDQGSYTATTYAGGRLLLRNLKELAAVRIVEGTAGAIAGPAQNQELKGAFGAFIKELRQAENKKERIDNYLSNHQFPMIEGKGLVHFVYRGDVEDIALVRGYREDGPLERVAGTDLFFRTMELDPAGHWNYHFNVFGDGLLDPLNPLVMGKNNELRMPQWAAPDYLSEPKSARGRLEEISFKSTIRADERKLNVYLPPGYEKSERRYPLMVVVEPRALTEGKMDTTLDNLINDRIAPLVVAFVPTSRPESMGPQQKDYIAMLSDELVPHLEGKYRLQGKASQRCIFGASRGAVIAGHAAFRRPDVFGRLATQTFIFTTKNDEMMKKLIAETDPSLLSAYVVISTNDLNFPGFDAQTSSRELYRLMKEKGFKVKQQLTAGGPSWGNWRGQTGDILAWFAPKKGY